MNEQMKMPSRVRIRFKKKGKASHTPRRNEEEAEKTTADFFFFLSLL